MEGPSLFLAEEQLVYFKGKIVKVVSGNTKIGKERFQNKKIVDIFSWGKHLVFQFDKFAVRIHFLLYGTFEANIKGDSITGAYRKVQSPRLRLEFEDGQITMFNCSIKIFETPNLKKEYDYSISVMSKSFDRQKAFIATRMKPDEEIADVLLDQTIFAGVGNIIKNEVLYIVNINPQQNVKFISDKKLKELINETISFSMQFYKWRKSFILSKNYQIYRRSSCPNCGNKINRKRTGLKLRISFYCENCQKL